MGKHKFWSGLKQFLFHGYNRFFSRFNKTSDFMNMLIIKFKFKTFILIADRMKYSVVKTLLIMPHTIIEILKQQIVNLK